MAEVMERGASLGKLASFGLASVAALALTVNAFVPSFHSARLGLALVAVLVLHVVRFARVLFVREALIYGAFVAYMSLQLLWTADRQLALNTLVPAVDFVIVLVLFGSLIADHDFKAVMAGVIFGFATGAVLYTTTSGFPFSYPAEFSYNAIATMYLFGFVAVLLLASVATRKAALLVLAAVIAAHIVATTSIKTNLGVVLGALVAAAFHFRQASRMMWRHALAIVVVAVALGFAVASDEDAVESLRRGADRVALGIRVLQAREDLPGYSAFEKRARWQDEGFRGWIANPLFGHGVEAFRARFGKTSHASHVDIGYNSGLIGLSLFYGVFASVLWRLYWARGGALPHARMVMLAGVSCLLIISFAGTMHYNAFLATVLALCIGLLRRAPGT